MLAVLSLILSAVAAVAVAYIGWKQIKLSESLAAIEQEKLDREVRSHLDISTTDWRSWSMASPTGPINELSAVVVNSGGIDSPPVSVHALIDGRAVGRSSMRAVARKGVATINVPMDEPQPFRGLLRLELIGSDGKELLAAEQHLPAGGD